MWRFITILIHSPPHSPLFNGVSSPHQHCAVHIMVCPMRGDTLVLGTDKEINRFPNDNENTWDGHLNYGNCTFSFFRISM